MKREGNKTYFRSAARRQAYDYLELRLKEAQRKLRDNRLKIYSLTKEQRELKADIAGLHQVMQEYKK